MVREIVKIFYFFLCFFSVTVHAQCGNLSNAYGPFDYRTATVAERKLVEDWHFSPEVQSYKPRHNQTLGGDVDYTLRAFPNNHRALLFMMNLSVREKTNKPQGALYTVSCYFDRAIRFRPEDGQVRLLHGIYLLKIGDNKAAVDELKLAEQFSGDDANTFYNLGLAFYKLKDFEKSLSYAHQAYALGFPLMGLKNELKRVGKWKDMSPLLSEPGSNNTPAGVVDSSSKKSIEVDSAQ